MSVMQKFLEAPNSGRGIRWIFDETSENFCTVYKLTTRKFVQSYIYIYVYGHLKQSCNQNSLLSLTIMNIWL